MRLDITVAIVEKHCTCLERSLPARVISFQKRLLNACNFLESEAIWRKKHLKKANQFLEPRTSLESTLFFSYCHFFENIAGAEEACDQPLLFLHKL